MLPKWLELTSRVGNKQCQHKAASKHPAAEVVVLAKKG